jgi:uncharacterized protein YkwD
MSRRLPPLALALLASAVMCAVATAGSPPGAVAARVKLGRYGTAMLHALNHARAQHGLPSLSADRRMDRGATSYSRAMTRHGFFSHGAWVSRVARAAGHARNVGEVLGSRMPGSARDEAAHLVQAWLESPAHRQVLLDGRFRRVGIGRTVGGKSGHLAAVYTVDFASAR